VMVDVQNICRQIDACLYQIMLRLPFSVAPK